jgi:hypothetical protein
VSDMRGLSRQGARDAEGDPFAAVDMTKPEHVMLAELESDVVRAIERAAHTGCAGYEKPFTACFEEVVRVPAGERDLRTL